MVLEACRAHPVLVVPWIIRRSRSAIALMNGICRVPMTFLHGELAPAELAMVVLPLGTRRRICLADEGGTPEELVLARPPVVERFLGDGHEAAV